MCSGDIFLGVLAILFPPVAVWVKRGICSVDSLINIALCCFGFLPGLLHAWYIILTYPEETYELVQQDPEGGTATYIYIQHPGPQYGTVSNAPHQQFHGTRQDGFVQPPQAVEAGASGAAEEVPPSYTQAVTGDNKLQAP